MKPNLDWVSDPDWKNRLQQAWDEYEANSETHLLYKYFSLVDEASLAIGLVDESQLSPGMWKDNAPSLLDMW